jgi:hypothetical protein
MSVHKNFAGKFNYGLDDRRMWDRLLATWEFYLLFTTSAEALKPTHSLRQWVLGRLPAMRV